MDIQEAGNSRFERKITAWQDDSQHLDRHNQHVSSPTSNAAFDTAVHLILIYSYAIESGNRELSRQIESGNDAIRYDLSNLQQDIRIRKERKVDLASTGGQHGSLFNGTDAGIPLRRYLEDLPPMSHPWAGASEIGEILSLQSLQVEIRL
jgi:hypothetical protein